MVTKVSRIDRLAKQLYELDAPNGDPWDATAMACDIRADTVTAIVEELRDEYRARARQQMEADGSLRQFVRGEMVKPRPRGPLELERYGPKEKEAQVLERMTLPANGDRVRVRWNGEYRSTAFIDVNLFDPA